MKPRTYLFPGHGEQLAADKPITPKVVVEGRPTKLASAPASTSALRLIYFDTASRRTCLKPVLTCALSRFCLGHGKIGDTAL